MCETGGQGRCGSRENMLKEWKPAEEFESESLRGAVTNEVARIAGKEGKEKQSRKKRVREVCQ